MPETTSHAIFLTSSRSAVSPLPISGAAFTNPGTSPSLAGIESIKTGTVAPVSLSILTAGGIHLIADHIHLIQDHIVPIAGGIIPPISGSHLIG